MVIKCFTLECLKTSAQKPLLAGEVLHFLYYCSKGETPLFSSAALNDIRVIGKRVQTSLSIVLSGRYINCPYYLIPRSNFPRIEETLDVEFATEIQETLKLLRTWTDWEIRPRPVVFVNKAEADRCLRTLRDFVDESLLDGIGVAFDSNGTIEYRYIPLELEEVPVVPNRRFRRKKFYAGRVALAKVLSCFVIAGFKRFF